MTGLPLKTLVNYHNTPALHEDCVFTGNLFDFVFGFLMCIWICRMKLDMFFVLDFFIYSSIYKKQYLHF